jgi:uncharacterized membrane protein
MISALMTPSSNSPSPRAASVPPSPRWNIAPGTSRAAALIALCVVPVAAGIARLAELARHPRVTPENARFVHAPAPVVVHIVGASVFCLLGALQLTPELRRRYPLWHRRAGRVVAACGVAAGLSGLWMTRFYALPESDGAILGVLRLVFGAAMVGCIVLGVVAARRRRIAEHRAWMARGYAIGLGAGTQALLHFVWIPVFGRPGVLAHAFLMGAAWLGNLAAAECCLRRRPSTGTQSTEGLTPNWRRKAAANLLGFEYPTR